MNKKSAFSLAETLIAISTIGVIAYLMVSTILGASRFNKMYTTQFDKIQNEMTNASRLVLYEDCMWGEKLSSFTPLEVRDSFASRLHINSTWNRGNSLRDSKDSTLSFLNISKSFVPGMTLSSGASIAFIDDELIQCDDVPVNEHKKKWGLADFILWILGLGPGPGDIGLDDEKKHAIKTPSECLAKKDIRIDGSRTFVGLVLVDVNGQSSPNRYKTDQFLMPLYDDGI